MDILRREGFTCQRVTYVVLDEADKMLSMGFGKAGCYIVYVSIINGFLLIDSVLLYFINLL